MWVEITIGEQNFTGVACGFPFERSKAIEEVDSEEDPRLGRLLLLFPRSSFKVLKRTEKKEAAVTGEQQTSSPVKEADDGGSDSDEGGTVSPGEDTAEDLQKEDAAGAGSESGSEGDETGEEGSSKEAEAGDEGSEADGEDGEEAGEEGSEAETESGEGEEGGQGGGLTEGQSVVAEYKGEMRSGVVVKILESGVLHVNLDDDDANYRVLDDDKVKVV